LNALQQLIGAREINLKLTALKTLSIFAVIILTVASNSAKAGLVKDQVLTIDGRNRTYDVFSPDGVVPSERPAVVLLHGHSGNADVITGENGRKAPYKVWMSIAQRENWFLIIPDGEIGPENARGWNDCRADSSVNPRTDDVKYINALVETVANKNPVDRDRVYIHGTSNGGHMAYRLAMESTETYRAIASVVAQMPVNNKCVATGLPISTLIMNGTEDPILPYEGGPVGRRKIDQKNRGLVLSTADSIRYWLNNNGISSKGGESDLRDVNRRDKSIIKVKRYQGGKNNTEVVLYEIVGGGHTEPSLTEHYARLYKLIVGNQNKDIEMAEEVWKFFERND